MLKIRFKLPRFPHRDARLANLVSCLLLALPTSIIPVQADTAHATFNVTVNLAGKDGATLLPGANAAFCIARDKPDNFGARVIVICQTGEVVQLAGSNKDSPFEPIHGGANRYVANLTDLGSFRGTVEGYMSAGTVASWRQVSFIDRDYLELLVAW